MSKKEILNIPVKDKIEILEGTYIRMHDGSKKKVEDILYSVSKCQGRF